MACSASTDQVEQERRREEADRQVRQHRVERMTERISTQERCLRTVGDPTGQRAQLVDQRVEAPVVLDAVDELGERKRLIEGWVLVHNAPSVRSA